MTSLTSQTLPQESTGGELVLENLAVAHYEQMYAVCHAFYDDPALCLTLTNQWFREATTSPSLVTVCRKAVDTLRRRAGLELLVPSCGLMANLTWLLKEVAGLRYAEIGEVLGMDFDEVKHTIASVREALLALATEQLAA
jgi:hypothetical protein